MAGATKRNHMNHRLGRKGGERERMGATGGQATHHEAWPVTVRTLGGAEAFFIVYLFICSFLRGRDFLHITGHLGYCGEPPASYSRVIGL